jgi:Flp pilus assembly protein TadG
MPLGHFLSDQRGAVMVEVTIILSLTLVLVLGAIDFLLLFYHSRRFSGSVLAKTSVSAHM